MESKVCVIGCGSWGTTISLVLARKGISVLLYGRNKRHIQSMLKEKENKKYLRGFPFPPQIFPCFNLQSAMKQSESIVVAVPSHAVSTIAKKLKKFYGRQPLLLATKGIHAATLETNSQIVKKIIPESRHAVISGPNLSHEIAGGKPAASVVASQNRKTAVHFQKLLSSDTFRIYTHHDVAGVELAGALKNIYAIGCGMSDGMKLGANSRAAFLTRGLAEMKRLGCALGAEEKTFSGLSGIGDMLATCSSPLSRNYTVGWHLAHGKPLSQILGRVVTTAEGVTAAKAAYRLAKRHHVDTPIINAMHAVLWKNKPVKKALTELMQRTLKHEEN